MTYRRRVLSGSEPEPVKARNGPAVPKWVKALDDAELAALALTLDPQEPERRTPRIDWITARRIDPSLWARSKSPDDFRTRLIAMLLAMLAVARQTHHPEDCDRIEAEPRLIGETPPA